MTLRLQSMMALWSSSKPYSLYVLLMLMVAYLLNQLDRFVLGIAGRSLAKDLRFGTLSCFLNTSQAVSNNSNVSVSCVTSCNNIHSESECSESDICVWDYAATGIEYQVLAGPAFTLVFTLAAIPLGLLAGSPRVNRRIAIALCLCLWSGMTLSASFTNSFWQLLLTRIGLGIFEAICTPFASSIISDMFNQHYRGTALGFYNWGIYIGYSLAFAFNFILEAVGWRWTFRVAALPGFLVALIMILTVKEPQRSKQHYPMTVSYSHKHFFLQVLKCVLNPSFLVLCLAGGVRQGGGLVWSYNVKSYFRQYYCSSVNVGIYLSWVPLVGGTLGAVLGGLFSDRLVRRKGQSARLWVLIGSQILAAPFVVGTIMLPPDPWAFLCLLPAYIIGEVWIGVCLAVVIEMVPRRVVAAAVACFLFVINNIGGLLLLFIPPLKRAINLRNTLLLLFPGSYIFSAALFSLTLVLFKLRKCRSQGESDLGEGEEEEAGEHTHLVQGINDDEEDMDILESQESLVVAPRLRHSIRLMSN